MGARHQGRGAAVAGSWDVGPSLARDGRWSDGGRSPAAASGQEEADEEVVLRM